MDINIYNELYKDFENLYIKAKKISEEYQETQNNIIKYIDKNSSNIPVDMMFKSMMTIVDYNNDAMKLIDKLESINIEYTRKYKEQFINVPNFDPTNLPKLPQIFILFRKLIRSVYMENYEECNRLKTKIITKY